MGFIKKPLVLRNLDAKPLRAGAVSILLFAACENGKNWEIPANPRPAGSTGTEGIETI
jgi:hypothetical protein